jgi:hypothetical protein
MIYGSVLAALQVFLLFSQVLHLEQWTIGKCTIDTAAGETCYLHLDEIRPGQLAVGLMEVQEKVLPTNTTSTATTRARVAVAVAVAVAAAALVLT